MSVLGSCVWSRPSPLGGRRRRAGVSLAVGLVCAVVVVPVVTAQEGDDHQDTVKICHFDSNGYDSAQARETDFYGAGVQGHGEHAQDIVPPFVIEDPRPGDPSSFDGRNWDGAGQALFNAGCKAPEPEPEKKVRICHATSRTDPYVSNEPAIANNGDLKGGHLDHTGPVYPAADWAIIPPYDYVDKDGKLHVFPGYNWGPDGQAIYQINCDLPPPPTPKTVNAGPRVRRADSERLPRALRLQQPEWNHRRGSAGRQEFVRAGCAYRGQPVAFGPAVSRTSSRWSSTAPRSPGT